MNIAGEVVAAAAEHYLAVDDVDAGRADDDDVHSVGMWNGGFRRPPRRSTPPTKLTNSVICASTSKTSRTYSTWNSPACKVK